MSIDQNMVCTNKIIVYRTPDNINIKYYNGEIPFRPNTPSAQKT